ncbi:MAG: hypothetical protein M5U25_00940 [Planctomycetota bacterium]|nr:hypothetical protein [Planctomycetota bacterium]
MADLAKLANLSKRLKSSTPKVNEEQSPLSGGAPASSIGDDDSSSSAVAEAPRQAPAVAAPVMSGGGGGVAPKVTLNVDLGPVTEMLGRIRDEMRNLRDEVKKSREKPMKVDFGDGANEQMDQILKHLSAVSKAGRELTEKLVTSLPESRWYGDLLNLGREVGEGIVAGGGGGGGGSAEDINSIKEQLEMQKTQLTAILSILQRR